MPINFRQVKDGDIATRFDLYYDIVKMLTDMDVETDREFLEYHGPNSKIFLPNSEINIDSLKFKDISLAYEFADKETLIGLIITSSNIHTGTINLDRLYIDPIKRRAGIARALYDFHMKKLNPGNELPLSLSVGAYNKTAIKFYEKLGFESLAQKMYYIKE